LHCIQKRLPYAVDLPRFARLIRLEGSTLFL
jgi:hypothetical protein